MICVRDGFFYISSRIIFLSGHFRGSSCSSPGRVRYVTVCSKLAEPQEAQTAFVRPTKKPANLL